MNKTFYISILFLIFVSNTLFAGENLKNLERMLTPQQMKADIKSWRGWLTNTHPELSIRIADLELFDANVNRMQSELNNSKTVREFLAELSMLNSQFNDGHMNILVQSQAKLINEVINDGNGLFPYEVIVDKGRIYIETELGGESSQLTMAELQSIDGTPISEIYDRLASRMYGDTTIHRESLLSLKFALYYWLFVDQNDSFTITYKHANKILTKTVKASKILPKALSKKAFEDLFKFELLNNKQALLTINLFWWEDKERFYQFSKNIFQIMKDNKIEHLIIDVRKNPGGDDDMWKKGLLNYIADKPYRHTSRYTKKIIRKYMDEGEIEGDVVTADYEKYEMPVDEEPLKFKGKVSIVVGKLTYSSAILFANTVQDFGFAEIVGESSAGYSWQTGGIQFFTLPNSRLKAVSPRFYLTRPSGKGQELPVLPNSPIADDPLNERNLIEKIVKNN